MKMVGREDISKELDFALTHGASKDAADELVGLVTRRQEKTRLDGAGRDEVDCLRLEVPNGIRHGATIGASREPTVRRSSDCA